MGRLRAAWGGLGSEQRTALVAALVLLGTMLLPWYSKSVDAVVRGQLASQSSGKLAITVFSWVEAAIFLVAVSVAALLLARGERRAFHLPGGDGLVVAAGGAWATFLVFYRFVDKPSGGGSGSFRVEYGLSWGIFFGLLAALGLLVSGLRLRGAHVVEPRLPVDPSARGRRAPAPGPALADPGIAERRREREQHRAERPRPEHDAAATVVQPRPPAADEPTTYDPPQLPFDQEPL